MSMFPVSFEMHPVDRGAAPSPAPLESAMLSLFHWCLNCVQLLFIIKAPWPQHCMNSSTRERFAINVNGFGKFRWLKIFFQNTNCCSSWNSLTHGNTSDSLHINFLCNWPTYPSSSCWTWSRIDYYRYLDVNSMPIDHVSLSSLTGIQIMCSSDCICVCLSEVKASSSKMVNTTDVCVPRQFWYVPWQPLEAY